MTNPVASATFACVPIFVISKCDESPLQLARYWSREAKVCRPWYWVGLGQWRKTRVQ